MECENSTYAGVSHDAAILDVGAGASVFVDDLVVAGFTDSTVLDQSPIGLQIARDRLAECAPPGDLARR